MNYSYEQRKPAQRQGAPKQRSELNPVQGSPTAFGADLSSSGASGHPVDLPGAIREKFENAFGADLSAVKFYRSQAVADAGAQAVTMGEKVVFAPGMLDFSSRSGQTLLGHELSHVVSRQRGEVTGAGFLNDPALEARADREGAMAAAGQQIAAPTAALSSATAAGASGPMQAKKESTDSMVSRYRRLGNTDTPASSILNSPVDTDNAYENSGDKAHSASGFSKVMKNGTPHIAAVQHGLNTASKFTDTHVARSDVDKVVSGETWGASPAASAISGGLGVITGGMNAYTGFTSMIRNLRNLKAGASKMDAAEGGLQMLAGLGGIGSGGASIAKVVSSTAATALKAGGGLQDLVPGLSIATGGVNAILGVSQLQRASNRKDEIDEQIASIVPEGPQGTLTNDQKMMLRTMRHGREIQKRNAILGGTKVLGGGLTTLGGILSLGGVTSAAGLGFSAAGSLVNGIGSIYNIFKNRRLRKNAIAEEYGGKSYSEVLKDVRESLGDKHISRSKAWEIFLRSQGLGDTKEDDVYADIRKRRAAHMLHLAAAGDGTATAFIESMGVKQSAQTASGSPTFAEGALDLLADKLK